jgi:lycopene beta-cyclase
MPSIISCDIAIVGGGLSGALIALALARCRPTLDIKIVEAGEQFGGNHVWSFFASDIAQGDRWIIAPFVSRGWTGYSVRFPDLKRTLKALYYSVESERLDHVLRTTFPPGALLTGRKATAVAGRTVLFADGDRVEAGGVIDARGPGDLANLELGWQKFVGREYELDEPHDEAGPTIMDASVPQHDGYRFVYTLPFAATRMFVEDTYYADAPDLDVPALRAACDRYAAERWVLDRPVREEAGVLPVAIGGDFEGYWRSGGEGVAKAGMRAGLFHPTTGYSLPDAVRTASLIAAATDLSGGALHELTHRFAAATWRARGFYRLLDTMLFRAAEPGERWRVLERFYKLDPALIGRFYAGRSTMLDKARILAGRPPVPVARAIAALAEAGR